MNNQNESIPSCRGFLKTAMTSATAAAVAAAGAADAAQQ
jgi:hypothetical protein